MKERRVQKNKRRQSSVRRSLATARVKPSKQRGQNFLLDPLALQAILEFAAPRSEERILEIGPGLGALTSHLVRFPNFRAIEIEAKLCRELSARYPGLQIIEGDVRSIDFRTLGDELSIISNLPYSISSDMTFLLIQHRRQINRAVFLMQREFAERLAGSPLSGSYGITTIATQFWFTTRLGPIIRGDSFHPPTQVESQVIELTPRSAGLAPEIDFEHFLKFVRAAFSQRRRTLLNSLGASDTYPKERVTAALQALGVSEDIRAEQLEIPQLIELFRAVKS